LLKKARGVKVRTPKSGSSPRSSRRFVRAGEAAARMRNPHVRGHHDVGNEDGPHTRDGVLRGPRTSAASAAAKRRCPRAARDIMCRWISAWAPRRRPGNRAPDLSANIFNHPVLQWQSPPKAAGIRHSARSKTARARRLKPHLRPPRARNRGLTSPPPPRQAKGARNANRRCRQLLTRGDPLRVRHGPRALPNFEKLGRCYQILHAIVQGDFQPPRAPCARSCPRAFAQACSADHEPRARRPASPPSTRSGRALMPLDGPEDRAMWRTVLRPNRPPMPPPVARPSAQPRTSRAPSGTAPAPSTPPRRGSPRDPGLGRQRQRARCSEPSPSLSPGHPKHTPAVRQPRRFVPPTHPPWSPRRRPAAPPKGARPQRPPRGVPVEPH